MKATYLRRAARGVKRRAVNAGLPASQKEMKYKGAVASEYLATRAPTVEWHRENILFGRLVSELPNELTVLDVPFGTGRFTPVYAAKGWTAFGLDISSEMLRVGKIYNEAYGGFISYKLGDATELPFEDRQFDGVISTRFLGYIPSLLRAQEALKEFARVSKTFAILHLQFLKEGRPLGNKDKMGAKWTEDDVLRFLDSVGLAVQDMVETSETDDYQNVLALCLRI